MTIPAHVSETITAVIHEKYGERHSTWKHKKPYIKQHPHGGKFSDWYLKFKASFTHSWNIVDSYQRKSSSLNEYMYML